LTLDDLQSDSDVDLDWDDDSLQGRSLEHLMSAAVPVDPLEDSYPRMRHWRRNTKAWMASNKVDAEWLVGEVMKRAPVELSVFPISIDTCASEAVTACREEFVTFDPHARFTIQGIASGLAVQGEGIVHWRLVMDSGKTVTVVAKALYCPAFKDRLLPPRGMWTSGGNGTGHAAAIASAQLTIT